MGEQNFARLRAHHSNVQRYRQLLKTMLTDLERKFIERRLLEEESAIESLSVTIPFSFKDRRPRQGGAPASHAPGIGESGDSQEIGSQ
jgi:hypothetical protein